MGHDIIVVPIYIVKKIIKQGFYLCEGKKMRIDGPEDVDHFAITSFIDDAPDVFMDIGEDYISFNFDVYEDIWNIDQSHGKTTEVMVKQLTAALEKLPEPEIPEGCDGWTIDPRVFAEHVKRLLSLARNNPGCVVISDQVDGGVDPEILK